MKQTKLGFTLIEVMIVVAIVGILAAVAYPSYTQYVAKANRSEAQQVLLNLANLMEQHHLDHRTYPSDLTAVGQQDKVMKTENGLYSVEITSATNSAFTIKATGKNQQATVDAACLWLTIDNTGARKAKSADCWEK
ncbi:type IV pilin protein [Thalassotalea euphylliae]|uniref:Type IV pilin protein n=1 Tax=Thalassotalea euphylliae TaxID=1655234 RepID=A0A3E0TNS7_9GAMM|nr:type IV pilin protein [Thalassotalea euphylliae]REL26007.1 type IV pilin protein [Thalassotalea euphylliae]